MIGRFIRRSGTKSVVALLGVFGAAGMAGFPSSTIYWRISAALVGGAAAFGSISGGISRLSARRPGE